MTESISVTHSAVCWNDRLLHYGYLCAPCGTQRIPTVGAIMIIRYPQSVIIYEFLINYEFLSIENIFMEK